MQWILATHNPGKAREFNYFLRDTKIQLKTLADIGYSEEIEESGSCFEENALIKANAVRTVSQLPVLADDSGLEVESLQGAPGIFTARYAGAGATDEQNLSLLLRNLQGKENRRAKFVCCLALVGLRTEPQIFRGECSGSISFEPRGELGFGYDPIFVPEGYSQTFADLGNEIKKKVSHRTLALNQLRASLI